MQRLVLIPLLAFATPLLAIPGDPFLSFEPLILGSHVLVTQVDLISETGASGSGMLTGIESLDAPLDALGEPGRSIYYPSQVLLAPVAFTPGSARPAGIPFTGAAPSFLRWLASDEAGTIVPELNLPRESASLSAFEETPRMDEAIPLTIALTGIGAFTLVFRSARRPAMPLRTPPPLAAKRKGAPRLSGAPLHLPR